MFYDLTGSVELRDNFCDNFKIASNFCDNFKIKKLITRVYNTKICNCLITKFHHCTIIYNTARIVKVHFSTFCIHIFEIIKFSYRRQISIGNDVDNARTATGINSRLFNANVPAAVRNQHRNVLQYFDCKNGRHSISNRSRMVDFSNFRLQFCLYLLGYISGRKNRSS